jgi:hypothetical protein
LSRRVNQQKKPLAPITKQDNFTHIAAKKFSSRLPLFLIQIVALQASIDRTITLTTTAFLENGFNRSG